MKRSNVILLVTVFLLLLNLSGFGQSTLVTLEGYVKDEISSSPLAGATIDLVNEKSGYSYHAMTDSDGYYLISGIQPGNYYIVVSISGFEKQKREGLQFNVGAKLKLSFILKLSKLKEEVVVEASVPMVEMMKSEIGSVVQRDAIEDLPMLDRNFVDLTVTKVGTQGERANAQPRGTGEMLVDGASNENVTSNSTKMNIPADAIQEFRVITNQFEAEYGNVSGLLRSVVTRSGSNEFQGRLSFFYRDETLDDANYFIKHASYKDSEIPKDQWNKTDFSHLRFGGFLGGPIIKDKMHFFLAYEGLRHSEYSTITSPLVANETVTQHTNNNQVFLKINYQIDQKNALSLRYGFERPISDNLGVGGLKTKERAYDMITTSHDLQLNWTNYPFSKAMNELRFLFSSSRSDITVPDPDAYTIDRPSGQFGSHESYPQSFKENRFQILDNFSLFLKNHTLKFGIDLSWIPVTGYANMFKPGYFVFVTDTPFDANDFNTYPLMFIYNTGITDIDAPYFSGALFVQDSWKATSRLTLNLGLRYNNYTCEGLDINNFDILSFNPRFGFSYDLFGDQTTSIRGGLGMFSNNPILNAGMLAIVMQAMDVRTMIFPNYPDPFQPNPFFPVIPGSMLLGEYLSEDDMIPPYTVQATLGFQRELRANLSVSIDFVLAKGYNQLRMESGNPVIPGTSYIREDMTRGDVWIISDNGKTNYKGMHLTLNKRYADGWYLEISYTLSSSKADVEAEYTQPASYAANGWDIMYGPTNLDALHKISISSIVDFPWGFQVSGLFFYQSALPWNAIYANDVNLDSLVSDFVDDHRNARRGYDTMYLNLRISNSFHISKITIHPFVELYNMTNHTNFTKVMNIYGRSDFANPIQAGDPRLLQMGIRFDF
ncbi:MAG: TonB-dependent receptor [Candidatus Aminicenantes bacterium]|nr:MAG: TonB-dependent receptor [Candidatus Aminicenantes bacterium]